jgi:hypothetical protein
MFMRDINPEFPQLWNPMWVVFLSIPIYYSIVVVFHKALGKFQDEDEVSASWGVLADSVPASGHARMSVLHVKIQMLW